ncbi:MAG: serine/threonine-protein kinase [Polyangiaceae bacterium]
MNHADIARLEADDRLEDAAKLALSRGLAERASELFERACAFGDAARAALVAGDSPRAFELAALAKDSAVESDARRLLARDAAVAQRVAAKVEARGLFASAARLHLELAAPAEAARCFENAAELLNAADAYGAAGDPRNAARCLEALLRTVPDHAGARLALGTLLVSHGRHRNGVKELQQIAPSAPEYARALEQLITAYDALGLSEAREQARARLATLDPNARAAPAPVAVTDVETVLFGRYSVEREVARTPTARVLEGRDRISGQRVALKLFSVSTLSESGRDALARFEREARILSSFSHPSILEVCAYLRDGPAVVLPWMAGGSLADLLGKGPIAPARAAEITIAVLAALGEAHRRGVLHRDVKPANVLFDEAGGAKLADFGTAHVSDAAATVTAGVIGTLGYMAPEQRSGEPANVRSDLYAAGALLCHALTGAPPDAGLPFLSTELGDAHREVLAGLTGVEAERPEDALEAIALVRSATWPTTVPAPRPDVASRGPKAATLDQRLEPVGDGRHRDRVLGRMLRVLSATPGVLERALGFARADDPCLASVLAHHADEHVLWIEDLDAAPIDAALSDDDRAELLRALESLHRAGTAHGAVDRGHVRRAGEQLWLRFPLAPLHHDPARDLDDLSRL